MSLLQWTVFIFALWLVVDALAVAGLLVVRRSALRRSAAGPKPGTAAPHRPRSSALPHH